MVECVLLGCCGVYVGCVECYVATYMSQWGYREPREDGVVEQAVSDAPLHALPLL